MSAVFGQNDKEKKNWMGGGGGFPLHKTLTLIMTKICNFCDPICDLTAAAGIVELDISYEGLLLTVLFVMMKI